MAVLDGDFINDGGGLSVDLFPLIFDGVRKPYWPRLSRSAMVD